jgi:hypothetical protein
MFCLAQGKENIMNLNGNYSLTTTGKQPLITKRMVMYVCVCVCVCVYVCVWLFVLLLQVKLLTSLLNRSFHNGTWNSPNMRHSFIFLPKEECNWLKTRNNKKSLKIPKEQSETVYRRRTDNTMAKRKSTKGQTTIDKTYVYKAKDRVTRTPLKTGGWIQVLRKGKQFLLH